MAFPKLLQRLFQNNGAGDKLNQDIIPDIPYSKITDAPSITVDSALSSTSGNPVQNKVINSALDGKLSTSGGTVSGAVTFNGKINASELKRSAGQKELIIGGEDNDGCVQLFPGESSIFAVKKSASLFLTSTGYTGNTVPAGSFFLCAMDATTGAKALAGTPDGSLTWCGKSLLSEWMEPGIAGLDVGAVAYVCGYEGRGESYRGNVVSGSTIRLVTFIGYQYFASDDRVNFGIGQALSGSWRLLSGVNGADYMRIALAVRIS